MVFFFGLFFCLDFVCDFINKYFGDGGGWGFVGK